MKKSGLLVSLNNMGKVEGFKTSRGIKSIFVFTTAMVMVIVLNLDICQAVPSYSRQTGLACTSCHTSFPELNSFGRQFKLNGYTLTNIKTIEAATDSGRNKLNLLTTPPLAAMVMSSFSHINKTVSGTQNNNVEFPQQLSLFYSGQVTPHIGTFIQLTYDPQSGTIGIDNTDIRYSNRTQIGSADWIYGFTLNNNPTVQDVWNTVPAWRYPFASSGVAPTPAAATLIEGALSGQVAGLGTYGLFNNLIYYEFSLYRSAPQGAINPPTDSLSTNIIKGLSPYWRLALQHQFSDQYLMIGTFGMSSNLYPKNASGPTDKYTDIGIDLQYEYVLPKANLSLHSSMIMEKRTFNATFPSGADNLSSKLNSFKIDANCFLQSGIGFTLGYFNITGDKDHTFYGTANGKPDSNGTMLEVSFLPWYNTKFAVQYVMYNKFDGQATSYDGSRNASQNNTLYCLAWISF